MEDFLKHTYLCIGLFFRVKYHVILIVMVTELLVENINFSLVILTNAIKKIFVYFVEGIVMAIIAQ